MTIYAGETVRISSTVTDFDANALSDANVTSAVVEIFDAVDDSVLEEDMTWDAGEEYWYYDWQTVTGATTTPIDAGTYRIRITFTGVNFQTWEYQKVKLKANPLPL